MWPCALLTWFRKSRATRHPVGVGGNGCLDLRACSHACKYSSACSSSWLVTRAKSPTLRGLPLAITEMCPTPREAAYRCRTPWVQSQERWFSTRTSGSLGAHLVQCLHHPPRLCTARRQLHEMAGVCKERYMPCATVIIVAPVVRASSSGV